MRFPWLKGHGTENDFFVLPDPDASIHGDLAPQFVAALCDRRRGLGADGVLRVLTTEAAGVDAPGADWFMDYRNADGSLAQMCGNGLRVFARYLHSEGLVPGNEFQVATRDGLKHVTVGETHVTVDMGGYVLGAATWVGRDGLTWRAREVHTGNPHAVTWVDNVADAGTLTEEPHYDTALFSEGVNIEFVERVGSEHVRMRVHERGAGETRSCGTGACAVAIATAAEDGREQEASHYRVDVPGGRLDIRLDGEGRVFLSGPAELVASGEMEWHL